MSLRYGVTIISKCAPRITVTIQRDCSIPMGQVLMYVKRVGEPTEFAAYPPLEIKGDQLLFEFDELLFSKDTGRYAGRLTIGGEDYSTVYLEYVRPYGVTAVENPHV